MFKSLAAFTALTMGIIAGVLLEPGPLYWLLAGLLLLCIAVLQACFNHRWVGWILLLCLCCSGGYLMARLRENYGHQVRLNHIFDGRKLVLEGVQVERSAPTTTGYRFAFRLKPGRTPGPLGKITVYSQGRLTNTGYGRWLRIDGKFTVSANRIRGFPVLDERRQIVGRMFIRNQPILKAGFGLPYPYIWANQLRTRFLVTGKKFLETGNLRLLEGMLFNETLGATADERRLIQEMGRTGTIHLLSVSGLHIGFLVAGLLALFKWLKIPRSWQPFPLILMIGFYALMTGLQPPVLRSGLMMFILISGERLGYRDHHLNRLSLAALILILVNPYNLFEVGFQLSFIATFGVVGLYPVIKEYFPAKARALRIPFFTSIGEGLLLSLSTQIIMIPVLVYYYQQISWSSPLVNLLLFVPAEFVVLGGLTGQGLGILFPWLARWILAIVNWALTLMRGIIDFWGGVPWAASWSPVWPWPWFIAYYVGLLLMLDLLRPNLLTGKRQWNCGSGVITVLIALNLSVWTAYFVHCRPDFLQVAFLDVGQGDAIFIKTPDGFCALVDSGDVGRGRSEILPFLHRNGIDHLDMVLITHGHRDHMGGLAEIASEIPIGRLYLPPPPYNPELKSLLAFIKMKPQPVYTGMNLPLGAMVRGQILETNETESENGHSLVLRVIFAKNQLLLTGDLDGESERIIARKYACYLRSEVLKVGHHGSNYGTQWSFLSQVQPRLAVISVGAHNQFGQPGTSLLRRLHSLGIPVYRTDLQGQIRLRMYPGKLLVTTVKDEQN